MLYKEQRNFSTFQVNEEVEPELYAFIQNNKVKARFSNYTPENLEKFARRIYELREHNTNNTTR